MFDVYLMWKEMFHMNWFIPSHLLVIVISTCTEHMRQCVCVCVWRVFLIFCVFQFKELYNVR